VVADGQVPPVRQQRRGVGPQDPAEVGGVLLAGVKVDEVGHRERQVQAHVRARHQRPADQLPYLLAHTRPVLPASAEKRVQRGRRPLRPERLGQVEHTVVDRHTDPTGAVADGEHAVGQDLAAEVHGHEAQRAQVQGYSGASYA